MSKIIDKEPQAWEFIKKEWLNSSLSEELKDSIAHALTFFSVFEGYVEGEPMVKEFNK